MNPVRIKRLFGGAMNKGQSSPLLYEPQRHEHKAIGLLFSNQVNLSLSFHNGTQLMLNQSVASNSLDIAPDARMIYLDHELKGGIIKGMVTSEILQNVSVYLIIETK